MISGKRIRITIRKSYIAVILAALTNWEDCLVSQIVVYRLKSGNISEVMRENNGPIGNDI